VNGAPEGDSGTFRFTGTIRRITVDLSGDLIQDSEADMKIAMARAGKSPFRAVYTWGPLSRSPFFLCLLDQEGLRRG